jgi:hypothetical protein
VVAVILADPQAVQAAQAAAGRVAVDLQTEHLGQRIPAVEAAALLSEAQA